MRRSRPPDELTIEGAGQDEVRLVGPSMSSWVYRSTSRPAFYRLLPIRSAPVEWRQRVREWISRPDEDGRRAGVAPIRAAEQYDQDFWLVRYEVPERSVPLATLLDDPSPSVRVAAMAGAVARMGAWRGWVGAAVLPRASDVVVHGKGEVALLAVPPSSGPDPEAVFAEPSRASSIPPEVLGVREDGAPDAEADDHADRYAVGALLWRCLAGREEATEPGQALARVANGTIFERARSGRTSPAWLARLPAIEEARALAERMTSARPTSRGREDWARLGLVLESVAPRLRPVAAALELRAQGRGLEALRVIQEVLSSEETYEHLLLAGDLAEQGARPLEALDYFERAVAADPSNPAAYERQLSLLEKAPRYPLIEALFGKPVEASRLDAIAWRNWKALPPPRQAAEEASLAQYLLWRGTFAEAAAFVHPRLFDEHGTFLSWKLEMNLAYAQALFGLAIATVVEGRPGAEKALEDVRAQALLVRDATGERLRRREILPGQALPFAHAADALLQEVDRVLSALRSATDAPPPS